MLEENTAPTTTPTTGDDEIRVTTAGQEPTEPAVTEPDDTKPTGTEKPDDEPGDIDSLPEWSQKLIRKLRQEAQTKYVKAEAERLAAEAAAKAKADAEAEAAKTRDAAIEALKAEYGSKFTEVAKVLGLVKDEERTLTPEQLLEQAKTEAAEAKRAREERDAKYRELLLEVAVQDAAAMHDARADRLLDSRAFMKAVSALDPDGEGYRVAVAEAVKAAVEADGDLKTVKPAPAPEPPAASGGTATAPTGPTSPEDMSVEQFMAAKIHRR